MASLPRPKSPETDLDKGLKAWTNQVLAKRRRNSPSVPHSSRPPTPTPPTHWWKKRRSSTASSGKMSSMRSTDSWPELADQYRTEWEENPENDPYAPDRWDDANDDQNQSTDEGSSGTKDRQLLPTRKRRWSPGTEWSKDPKDDLYIVDWWKDTTNKEERGPDGSLSSESRSSGNLADNESFDWTIKARIPPWPTPWISNRALRECIEEEREWWYNAKTMGVWDLPTWGVPYWKDSDDPQGLYWPKR
ncbi:uncharacterized protein BT62DRAFT_917613 [Guyanagaster necrorhizus]|uniref:Uncharacterized protein n=1 Tax=Guyanagaster necrorhizus TaxID=856835 RepID=A0A9P7VX82_9AGAR|nr:uncharacterized protein BT62DRAFT_917613 [Guyanagaster necrorhizus MCA 3950]KAG7448918.1 hypothetical protein BT62DRAFT_917613 [Guyanagaster necrorhizus MCA 3950]